MTHYQLTLKSKNKTSLNNFLIFFENSTKNFYLIKKYFQKKQKKKVLTLLKSPHVNKTAQEQFEFRTFSKQINIFSFSDFKTIIFLKQIKTNLFPDVKIKVKIIINKIQPKKTKNEIFNPNNFKCTFFDNIVDKNNILKLNKKIKFNQYQKNQFKQTKTLLKIFDIYGETTKLTLFR